MADLQKSKSNTLSTKTISESLVKIESTYDLLKTKPMAVQIKDYGQEAVFTMVRIAVEKCIYRLGIEMDEGRVIMLCKDIMEVYSHDSIEDVKTALRRAGQGMYGLGFNKRGVITMVMVAEWMGRLLEEKALEREKIIKNRKAEEPVEFKPTDEESAKKYLKQIQDIIKESIDNEPKPVAVFDHKSDSWIKELKKFRSHRLVYRLVMNKIEAGQELSEKENEWLEKWNIKH